MDNNTPNEPRLAESLRRTVERRKELLSTADRIEADLHFGEKISAQTMASVRSFLMDAYIFYVTSDDDSALLRAASLSHAAMFNASIGIATLEAQLAFEREQRQSERIFAEQNGLIF